MGLISELRRRNVLRMAVLYVLAAWVVMQVAGVLMDVGALPVATGPWVLVVLVIGFPIALVFSWLFEITPEGLALEKDVPEGASITHITGRRMDFIVIAVLSAGLILFAYHTWWIPEPPERSVAVLPFVNRSNIVEDAFFVEGMQDDLLTLLSKLSSVEKVISRTSTEQYRSTTKSIPQIGKELGVATILEGAVQRSGSQVRINVQLIDTETEKNLWADTYDRDLTAENLFAIQSAITREIVAALHGLLTEQESEVLQVMPTNSLDAYEQFLLGRHEMARRTGEGIIRARKHFERAVELDPDYALAYVSLAETYELQPEYLGTPVEDILLPAQAAIDRALSIDPLSGEAYTSLAGLRQLQQLREESERYYLRAIELSPGYATAYHWYSTLLWDLYRFDEAHMQLNRAIQLDPLAPVLTDNLVLIYLVLGRNQQARTTILTGLERHPGFPALYIGMAELLWDEGQLGDALRWAQAASKLDSSSLRSTLFVCGLYLALGDDQAANACFEEINDTNLEASTSYSYSAMLYHCERQFGNTRNPTNRLQQIAPAAGAPPLRYLAWSYVVCGDLIGARSILEETDPSLFGDDDVVIDPIQIFSTVAAAYLLYHDGEKNRANYLFDQALETIRSMRRNGWLGYRLLDAFIYVTRGDQASAILALRDAVETGWRSSWWELRFPHFASMQDDSEWMELVAEIEAGVRQQRQWFEEHKDDPLF
jgi:TolB-like protein/Tfp pilus assembly protein PilF